MLEPAEGSIVVIEKQVDSSGGVQLAGKCRSRKLSWYFRSAILFLFVALSR